MKTSPAPSLLPFIPFSCLLFLIMAIPGLVAGQNDSLQPDFQQYAQTKSEKISRWRRILTDKFISGDMKEVKRIKNYLVDEFEDDTYLVFFAYELTLQGAIAQGTRSCGRRRPELWPCNRRLRLHYPAARQLQIGMPSVFTLNHGTCSRYSAILCRDRMHALIVLSNEICFSQHLVH